MNGLWKRVLSGLLLCFLFAVPGLADTTNLGILLDTTLTGGNCINLGIIHTVSNYRYGIWSPTFDLFNIGSGDRKSVV